MPSGLEYNLEPGYQRRDFFQPFVDSCRGGGLLEDSDLSLQIILGNMEISSNPSNHVVQNHLDKLYKLLNICEEKSYDEDRSYHLEAKLIKPSDISDALKRHKI